MRKVLEGKGNVAAFVLTDAEVAAIGEGKRSFPVLVTVGDHAIPARLTQRGGRNLIGMNQAVRRKADLEAGQTYHVTVTLDAGPREIEVPPALAAALDEAGLRAAFDGYAPSHRKEWARSVAEAKKEDTRDRRVAKVLAALRG